MASMPVMSSWSPTSAPQRGLTSTVCFPVGNLAPEGSVIKSTSIDPSVVDADGVYRKTGPARVFTTEPAAIAAIKTGQVRRRRRSGPHVPRPVGFRHGRDVSAHVGSEASGVRQACGASSRTPDSAACRQARASATFRRKLWLADRSGKLLDGDLIEIVIDRNSMEGTVNFVGEEGRNWARSRGRYCLLRASRGRISRPIRRCRRTRDLGSAAGCQRRSMGRACYDVDSILKVIEAGKKALAQQASQQTA